MRFLLLFAVWATVAFVPAWLGAGPYQASLSWLVARSLGLAGIEISFTDLELFYPFDLGVYAALCLASYWHPLGNRLRALARGLPLLLGVELLSLFLSVLAMFAALRAVGPGGLGGLDELGRFLNGLIRIVGLAAAATVWFWFLGREAFWPGRVASAGQAPRAARRKM